MSEDTIRVLIVDDHSVVRRGLNALLATGSDRVLANMKARRASS